MGDDKYPNYILALALGLISTEDLEEICKKSTRNGL